MYRRRSSSSCLEVYVKGLFKLLAIGNERWPAFEMSTTSEATNMLWMSTDSQLLLLSMAPKRPVQEIVKQSVNAPLSGLLYLILQLLDEEYLKVDAELGGLEPEETFSSCD